MGRKDGGLSFNQFRMNGQEPPPPLPPATSDHFLAGGRPSPALPSLVCVSIPRIPELSPLIFGVKPAQVVPGATPQVSFAVVMAGAENGADQPGAPFPASRGGHGVRQFLPVVGAVGFPSDARGAAGLSPVGNGAGVAELPIPGDSFRCALNGRSTHEAHRRTEQVAGVRGGIVAGLFNGAVGLTAKVNPLDPLSPPPLLPGELKNAIPAYSGDAGFPLGQPALLGGDKAAENAAFPRINGIIPFIAVFAGLPGFGFAESVGLVDAAVEGFAPVFGQGFQDGGSPVGVGKGLPVGAVPGDRPALRRGCPPPLLRSLKGIGQGRLRFCGGTWQFPPG